MLEKFNIGQMRSDVVFLANSPTTSATASRATVTTGGQNDVYTQVFTTRGKLKKKSGNRALDLGLLAGQESYQLIVRYDELLNPFLEVNGKVLVDSVEFTIQSWEVVNQIRDWYIFQLATQSASTILSLGTEEITNGNFSLASGWTLGPGWSYGVNKAVFFNISGTSAIYQLGTLSTTRMYRVSFDVTSNSGFVVCQFGNNKTTAVEGTNYFTGFWADVLSHGGIKIYFMVSTDFDGSITNVSAKQVLNGS